MQCYVLVENYEDGLILHELLDTADIANRIAPTPTRIRHESGCGMCLLLSEEDEDRARAAIKEKPDIRSEIKCLEGELKPRRDRYC